MAALRTFLPDHCTLWREEDTRPYECDGLTLYRQLPMVVALPATEEQVSRIARNASWFAWQATQLPTALPVAPRVSVKSLRPRVASCARQAPLRAPTSSKPYQKPHPPLWVACSQLDTIAMAGKPGMGALGFQFVSAEAAHAWVATYYNEFVKRQEKLADYATNPNLALVSGFMCADTDEEAMRRADGWTFFQFALRFYSTQGPVEPGTVNLWQEYQAWKESPAGQKARASGLVGSPETLRRKLRRIE